MPEESEYPSEANRLAQEQLDKLGMSWPDLARALGHDGSQRVTNWRKRGIPPVHFRDVEAAIGIKPFALETGNTSSGPDVRGTVPLISRIQAGRYVEVIDNLQPGEGEPIDTTVPVKRYTFALRVEGDSMEPDLPEGSILIVEPEMEAQHNDYVIVKNGEGANVKQLIRDGNDWYLKPANPRYPIKLLTDGSTICGVVRGMEKRFR